MKQLAIVFMFLGAGCTIKTLQSPAVSASAAGASAVQPATHKTAEIGGIESYLPDVVDIDGDYCPVVEQICLQWVDINGKNTDPPKGSGRCGVFKSPSKCMSKTVKKHFKIDRYEYPNKKGAIPQDWMTWHDAKNACEAQGKRLCTRSEWTLACEGPKMQPYPYGDGYHRDTTSCNTDNHVGTLDVFKSGHPGDDMSQQLRAFLTPSGSKKNCVSPYGVYDQVGNIDEEVVNETGRPYKSGLMGGHVFGVRNACRPMTDGHAETFSWYETGFRCCLSSSTEL
jgi:Sulfatase-modifying factor enzyme 1